MLESFFFIKKETLAQMFPCEFCEISKKTAFTEQLLATASITILFDIFHETLRFNF